MRNIKIVVKRDNYIVVIADTFRFGKNEVFRVDARNPRYFASTEVLTITH